MLADWLRLYRLHPWDNDLTEAELDLLTADLLLDPNSRTFAAMHGGVGLDTWAAVTVAGGLAALIGVEVKIPGAARPEPVVPPAELENARQRLRTYSAVAGLPEE